MKGKDLAPHCMGLIPHSYIYLRNVCSANIATWNKEEQKCELFSLDQ